MNCVGVTCLSIVCPSGNLNSWPPYLAEVSFHVPISLLSALAPPLGSSARSVAAVAASATTATRHRNVTVTIGSPSPEVSHSLTSAAEQRSHLRRPPDALRL